MQASNVAHARQVTAAAFAKGTVPAPYYLHVLRLAQQAAMRTAAPGCAGKAGGTVRVQRFTAGHKVARGATQAPATPTATRRQWVTRKVRVHTKVHGWRVVTVTNQTQVAVVQ